MTRRRMRHPAASFLLVLAMLSSASSANPSFTTRRRRLVMFGNMDDWIQRQVLLASTMDYKPPPMEDEDDLEDYLTHHHQEKPPVESHKKSAESPIPLAPAPAVVEETPASNKKPPKAKMWPPWPFNLLQRSPTDEPTVRQGPVARVGGFVFGFFGQRARVSMKELQDIGSRLWFHLPPMTPPLMLLTLLPRQESQVVASVETGTETVVMRTVIPLWSNPLARNLVLTGFTLAIMSWAHSELNRFRKLTPLPLNYAYRDIHSAVLPHVLPDEVPEPFIVEDEEDADEDEPEEAPEPVPSKSSSSSSISRKLAASVPPRLQKHFKQFRSSQDEKTKKKKSAPAVWRNNMKRMRQARRSEAQKVRRMAIYDELVALQAIKRKAARPQRSKGKDGEEPLGYALVTGASRGIGRSIAVELARWEVPLILVARDLPRLESLAYDLEACYGIKCCVLQADLSQVGAAEQIHQATQEAGLTVDILVNNAGVSSTGLAVDMPMEEVLRMIRVNGVAVAQLAHLYGKDMKDRRRGRILMVSSVVGAVTAGPTVAMYAATKAFEKALGLSMAKELEPYGVGVTCLMPGAVRGTDFRSASSTQEALCWKLPGYPKAPATVAEMGIRALLSGNAEVTPGWQNRAFVKVFQPAVPQRLHNILVEIAWNPLQVPTFLKLWKSPEKRQNERQQKLEDRNKHPVDIIEQSSGRHKPSLQDWRPRSNMNLPPPLLLTVPGEKATPAPVPAPAPAPVPKESEEEARPLLVGPDPVVEAPDPELPNETPADDTSANTAATAEIDQSTGAERASTNDGYAELRKLAETIESPSGTESMGSQSSVERSSPVPESDERQQLQQQQQSHESGRQMLQMKEQILQLQQQVQKQERDQFLQQMELEREKLEMEYEKRNMERARRQQEQEKARPQWRKRPARRFEVPDSPSKPEESTPVPKVINPKPRSSSSSDQEVRKRDLMSESLEHPLMHQEHIPQH